MSNAFSAIFNPEEEDVHNVWSAFNSLQRRPASVYYESFLPRPTTSHSSRSKPLEIYIDGPNGAPASDIFDAEHAVLIATGIGVTPFASILQSIMHR